MTEKEDYIHNDPSPWRDKAIELLAKIKAERAGKEFVRIPLESRYGYYEIEKSKLRKAINRITISSKHLFGSEIWVKS